MHRPADRLAEVDPAALALGRVCAFLAPEPIPAEVLTRVVPPADGRPPELAALAVAVARPVAAHRSLGRVGRYGLARVETGVRLHRLTQAVLRDQLGADETTAYRAYAEALLVAADPGLMDDPTSWPGWARLLPHLLAIDPANSRNPDVLRLAGGAVLYLHLRGDSQPARELAEHLHRTWRDSLGPDDLHTLGVGRFLVRTDRGGPLDRRPPSRRGHVRPLAALARR